MNEWFDLKLCKKLADYKIIRFSLKKFDDVIKTSKVMPSRDQKESEHRKIIRP